MDISGLWCHYVEDVMVKLIIRRRYTLAMYFTNKGEEKTYPLFENWEEDGYFIAKHIRTGKVSQGRTQKEAEENILILLQLIEETKRLDIVS